MQWMGRGWVGREHTDCLDGIEEDEIEVKQMRGMSGDRYSPGTRTDYGEWRSVGALVTPTL